MFDNFVVALRLCQKKTQDVRSQLELQNMCDQLCLVSKVSIITVEGNEQLNTRGPVFQQFVSSLNVVLPSMGQMYEANVGRLLMNISKDVEMSN